MSLGKMHNTHGLNKFRRSLCTIVEDIELVCGKKENENEKPYYYHVLLTLFYGDFCIKFATTLS